ncbi:MAG: hypothetical protein U0V64_15140 [Cyclobacteriaceae bacterium]
MKRLQQLSFVIGLFFLLAGCVLLISYYTSDSSDLINFRSGWTYVAFAVLMMLIPLRDRSGKPRN